MRISGGHSVLSRADLITVAAKLPQVVNGPNASVLTLNVSKSGFKRDLNSGKHRLTLPITRERVESFWSGGAKIGLILGAAPREAPVRREGEGIGKKCRK